MSRRQRAFILFDQGLRPSDPQVKALGLSPHSTYNYFQMWKKALGQQATAPDPVGELRQQVAQLKGRLRTAEERVRLLEGLLAMVYDHGTMWSRTLSSLYDHLGACPSNRARRA